MFKNNINKGQVLDLFYEIEDSFFVIAYNRSFPKWSLNDKIYNWLKGVCVK